MTANPAPEQPEGIIVLACPRSGTTLLRRILNAHPNIACPGETYLLTACARFLQSERAADGMDVGVLNGLHYAGFQGEDVLGRLRELAFSFRREHARREGKRRWAEKTAVDAFHLREIEKLFGEHATFICMTRHGLDVACSIREWCERSGFFPSELHRYIQRYQRPLEAFCRAWVDASNSVLDFASRHESRSVVLRYEDLVNSPDDEARRLFDFLGEPWDPSILDNATDAKGFDGFSDWKTFSRPSIDHASVGRWRSIPSDDLGEMAAIVNPTLERCGYAAVKCRTSTDEGARRRYELGLMLQSARGAAADGND